MHENSRMLTLCLLFYNYARAIVKSVTILLAFTYACRQKKHHVMGHMKFAAILCGILWTPSCVSYMLLI